MLSIVIPSVLAPTAPVATHWAKMVSNTPDTKARTSISDQPLWPSLIFPSKAGAYHESEAP